MNKWISVKDRLPKGAANDKECSEIVIVFTVDNEVTAGWCHDWAWYVICGIDDFVSEHDENFVTHWMPLPAPPKEV